MSKRIYYPFGLQGYANELEAEFWRQPFGVRLKYWRGIISRELTLWLSGQKFLQKKRFEIKGTPRILWIYDGLSMGDCIMDLSQRALLAKSAVVDICITRAPIVLFKSDPSFRKVVDRPEDCDDSYDFILLHNISTASLRLKRRFFSRIPFATMLDHQQGEMYDRITYAWCRFNQLFNLNVSSDSDAPERPALNIDREIPVIPGRICVALGGVDRRRCYAAWPQVLQQIVDGWTQDAVVPHFVLVGAGANAQSALAAFSDSFLDRYCDCAFDVTDIQTLRDTVASADYFLGVDGGLMHIAEALGKPGLAIFAAGIRPGWRLLASSRLLTLDTDAAVGNLAAESIATEFLANVLIPINGCRLADQRL